MRYCAWCNTPLKGHLCPSCKHWNLSDGISIEQVVEQGRVPIEIIDLSKVEPSTKDRIVSGPWDRVFGPPNNPGIVRTTVNLVSGGPGVGKSTLFQHMLQGMLSQHTDDQALYIATEEDAPDLAGRAASLGLTCLDRIKVIHNPRDEIDIQYALEKVMPLVAILDSLSGMVGRNLDYAEKVLITLRAWAEKAKCPFLVIKHVTKEDPFDGRISDQHLVSGTFTFEKDELTGCRTLTAIKNRQGPSDVKASFAMTESGLVWVPEEKT